jgi:hypothetical protein
MTPTPAPTSSTLSFASRWAVPLALGAPIGLACVVVCLDRLTPLVGEIAGGLLASPIGIGVGVALSLGVSRLGGWLRNYLYARPRPAMTGDRVP